MKGFFHRRRSTIYGIKKRVFFTREEQPAQDKIMEIDRKTARKMQRKMAKAMALLSEASIDATYIARYDETAAQRLSAKAKEVQTLSRELNNEFKANAPMDVWHDGKEEKKEEPITWRTKQ